MQEEALGIEGKIDDDQVPEEKEDHVKVQLAEQESLIKRLVQEEENNNEFLGLDSQSSIPSSTHPEEEKSRQEEHPEEAQKQLVPYTFTEHQEIELAEWYRDQECLYNRRIKSYKSTVMKTRLIEEKAKEFDPECSGE